MNIIPLVSVPLNITDQDEAEETVTEAAQNDIAPKIVEGPQKTFAFLNNRVELICKAIGNPAPKIIWHSKTDRNLPRVAHNYRIHKNGSLIFRSVEKSDESEYGCVARNSAGKDESAFVKLSVDGSNLFDNKMFAQKSYFCIWIQFTAKVEIVKCPDVVREKYGTPVDLQCAAIGDPPPLITWLKEGSPVRQLKFLSNNHGVFINTFLMWTWLHLLNKYFLTIFKLPIYNWKSEVSIFYISYSKGLELKKGDFKVTSLSLSYLLQA